MFVCSRIRKFYSIWFLSRLLRRKISCWAICFFLGYWISISNRKVFLTVILFHSIISTLMDINSILKLFWTISLLQHTFVLWVRSFLQFKSTKNGNRGETFSSIVNYTINVCLIIQKKSCLNICFHTSYTRAVEKKK